VKIPEAKRPAEIALGHGERTRAKIERPQFESDARQIRVEQQHTLERRDGRLVIAEPRRYVGIGEGGVEVCRIGLLKQLGLLRYQRRPLLRLARTYLDHPAPLRPRAERGSGQMRPARFPWFQRALIADHSAQKIHSYVRFSK
jgi:hypothetical protein